MKVLQLYKEGHELLATDGIMYVDGRLSLANIVEAVKTRNERFASNFPHKVCDEFGVYRSGINSSIIARTKLKNY